MTMKRTCILSILISIIPFAVLAQAPEIGRIAIYADSFRTTSEVDVPEPFTPFDIYIFCQPGENGMNCAEFALESSTSSMVISSNEWHPGLSVVLGDLASGVSACFLECQTDWVCINRVTMLNTIAGPASIEIVRHPFVGYYQFANCLENRPIEPVFIGPGLCINSSCPPDTDPPVPVSIDIEDDSHLTLYFDEKVFEPDAVNPARYTIYTTDGTEDTIPVNFALLQGEEDRVWMVLGELLADAPYTLEIIGLRDVAGNAPVPGTGIAFHGFDTTPPTLEYVYAPDEYTAMLVFSEAVTEASAEDLSNYTFGCQGAGCTVTPQPVSAVLQPDGRSVAVAIDYPMAQDAVYQVRVEGITDLAGHVLVGAVVFQFLPPDSFPPYIAEVSITADTAFVLLWNETLDPVTAEDLANYSFSRDGPPAEPMTLTSTHLVSGIYLRLGFEPAIDSEAEYTLYVSGVMDTSMNVMLPDTVHIIPLDSIPPLLVNAECLGLLDIDLTFSEPIDPSMTGSTSFFQVCPLGNPETLLDISDISCHLDCSVVRLHLAENLTAGADYTVRVTHIRDLAGNSIPSQQRDFTCYDVYPPEVIEIFLSDPISPNIRFTEAVNNAALETANYTLFEAADSTALVDITSAALYDGRTRVVLKAASPLALGEMYTLKMNGIEDLAGNLIDPDTSWTFAADDIVGPVLINRTVTSDSIVHLEFHEKLDPVTAGDIAKYAVVEAGDTSARLPLQSATLDPTGMIVDLEIDGQGVIGRLYVAWIMGVADISGNALYTASSAFQFIDDIPPRVLSAEGVSSRHVLVYFNEQVTRVTTEEENNYRLYPAGDPEAEIDVFRAERQPDRMMARLVLSTDMVQDTDYTLEVSGVMDLAGHIMEPGSVDFHFLDVSAPVILNVSLVNPTRLSIDFSEPVDSVTASDAGNYSVYLSSNASQQISVTSIDWMTDEVRLNLASEPTPNVHYTVRIDGVEDRFGNACSELIGSFIYYVYVPSTKIYLYADDGRYSQEVDAGMYQPFRIYVWVEPGDNGVYGVEYALSLPETYFMTGVTLNPVYVSVALGDPYGGHSVALSMCANSWFWVDYIDCICINPDNQELVWVQPHPDVEVVQIASCLEGHPIEAVTATYPLLINGVYVGTLLDSWATSFSRGGIELTWSILDTGYTPEFEVSRTLDGVEVWKQLDGGMIRGDGRRYTMFDSDLEFGRSYRYRVYCIDAEGRKVLFETDAVATPVMPMALHQNSPNPFNPATSIGFYLPQPGHVRLEIFDVNGRLVNILVDGHYTSGEHSIEWEGLDRGGSSVSSGVYFYRLIAGKESLSRKMVLLR